MAKIKICGIKSFKDIEYINEAKPDYIGFVFAESRRRVDFNLARLLKTRLDRHIQSVGVFVNEDIAVIKKICDEHIIDIIQIHGDEDAEYISILKKTVHNPIIKAVRVKERMNMLYSDADYILFDTFSKTEYGGTGESFNWAMARGCSQTFFLAGGLNNSNVVDAIKLAQPYCVDISSGVETKGVKDRQKIIDVVNLVRSIK